MRNIQNVHFVDFGEKNKIMLQTVGVTEARNNLGELLNTVRYRGDTVLLLKSGTPMAAIVPLELLEKLQQEREKLFSVVDEVQERNQGLGMDGDEVIRFVNEIVHEVRAQR
ncbi:MAG: type II toxin-antitoxin system Phd/YefM family antitoxin [Caldilineaceae bacterium]|nr:type II toxin-antitoxin system Phd/YefM family antitoxin [Caldilineaceae bacterium]